MRSFSILSILGLWGLGVVFAPVAQATTVTNIFNVNIQVKEWCENSATHATAGNFNSRNEFTLTVVSDPLNTGTPKIIQAMITNLGVPGATVPDLEAITMQGVAHLTNRSGTLGQFGVSGVNALDPSVSLTLRGKFLRDKDGLLTKVLGTLVWHRIDLIQGPALDCFGNGTFQTKTKIQ